MSSEALSWREQLQKVKQKVVEEEKRREEERRLQLERTKEAIQNRLKEDTPEALQAAFAELKNELARSAREFFALPALERMLQRLGEFGAKLRFYKECQKDFGKLFSPKFREALDKLLRDMGEAQRTMEKQLGQWRPIQELLGKTSFRPRTPADDETLLQIAKNFYELAHGTPLSLPKDFFANEKEHFYVCECEGKPYGYVKYWPAENEISFAAVPPGELNFTKFVRGLLYHFARRGPLAKPLDVIRVRVSFAREVKFYTQMGFIRAETHGMSDWSYQCRIM